MKKVATLFLLLVWIGLSGQNVQSDAMLKKIDETLKHRLDVVGKLIDDVMWYQRLQDVAYVDKFFITGPPLAKEKKPTAQGAGNPVKFWAYAFFPRNIDTSKKYPLIVLPHGGVHADFTTYYYHIVREMVWQGYVVVAPEYRGSTGYGKDFYEKIDYGGLEVEDALASKNYMIENFSFIDSKRVGIVGWSHGGMIALLNVFNYPNDYAVAFAGVPVSDLVARMGYKNDTYRAYFETPYHIGVSANDNVEEYRRRSPVWNVHKFRNTPLLIHTNTNDEDVNVLEVESLIRALKAEGKKFQYEIFQNIPGGHSFDRMDTKFAKETRVKIYKFLGDILKPERPIKSYNQIQEAGYRF